MKKIDKDDPGLMVFPEGIMEAGCVWETDRGSEGWDLDTW